MAVAAAAGDDYRPSPIIGIDWLIDLDRHYYSAATAFTLTVCVVVLYNVKTD